MQLQWRPGMARKQACLSSSWWHLACLVPGICFSSLPVKGSSVSGAGNIPLAQFPLQASLLEVCPLFHSVMAGQFISTPSSPTASISEPALAPHKQDSVASVFKQASRQQTSPTALDRARIQGVSCERVLRGLLSSPEHSASPRAPLLGEVRGLLALGVHGVHCHGCLEVVAVMERRVVRAVVVELVTQEGCGLRWGVQVQVLIVVAHVHPR